MTNLIGQSLGRYHILKQLSEGGMATVYKAYDTRLEADVAVKVIRTEQLAPNVLERALKRFEREAKALAKLTHPNIIPIIDYGEHEGSPYLVMKYLPGGTLKKHITGKPMPWQEAARLLIPVARALDYAHRQGMIHRDVKPSNILITDDGEQMLTDFGIAKIIDEEATIDLTGTSAAVGTPEYMAPEQATSKNVDHRADIYALGIVFYEMVTGRRPFQADTPLAVLFKQASEPLPRPTQFMPNLPDGVEKILLKALAKKPEDRYPDMAGMAAALDNLLTAGSQVSKPAVAQTTHKAKPVEDTLATIEQKDTYATILQELTHDKLPPAPVKQDTISSFPPPPQKSTWLPWVAGLGGIVVVALIVVLIVALGGGGSAAYLPTPTEHPLIVTETPATTEAPAATEPPALGIGSTWTRPADGMVMMYVPEGNFTMGSNNGALNEMPAHTVYLDAYWIDKTEVTNAMYALCVQAGVCQPPYNTMSGELSSHYSDLHYANHPVINIVWNKANTYCQWAGARLSTEAEWEKAARGTDGRTYPWGNSSPSCSLANFDICVGNTIACGSYPSGASPYGVLDMAGNVLEWVADWYSDTYYSISPSSNPQGPASGQYHVARGGSWANFGEDVSSVSRGRDDPGNENFFGFRCSLSSP